MTCCWLEVECSCSDFEELVPPVQLLSPSRAQRPGLGKDGEKLKVVANHFRVSVNLKQAFHFDVTIAGMRRQGVFEEVSFSSALSLCNTGRNYLCIRGSVQFLVLPHHTNVQYAASSCNPADVGSCSTHKAEICAKSDKGLLLVCRRRSGRTLGWATSAASAPRNVPVCELPLCFES